MVGAPNDAKQKWKDTLCIACRVISYLSELLIVSIPKSVVLRYLILTLILLWNTKKHNNFNHSIHATTFWNRQSADYDWKIKRKWKRRIFVPAHNIPDITKWDIKYGSCLENIVNGARAAWQALGPSSHNFGVILQTFVTRWGCRILALCSAQLVRTSIMNKSQAKFFNIDNAVSKAGWCKASDSIKAIKEIWNWKHGNWLCSNCIYSRRIFVKVLL